MFLIEYLLGAGAVALFFIIVSTWEQIDANEAPRRGRISVLPSFGDQRAAGIAGAPIVLTNSDSQQFDEMLARFHLLP